MKVDKNKVVALSYTLTVDGKTADHAGAEKPLEYIHGTGMLLPRFEEEVHGKEQGEEFRFTLTPEEGYGLRKEEYLITIPLAAFTVDGKLREDLLQVGRTLPMLDGNGNVLQGTVVEVGANGVKMDFNHPMAGKTLNFSGKVESVRDATQKELTEGLHGEYLPPKEHECHRKGKGEGCCKKDGEGCHKNDGEHCCKDGECCDKD